VVKSARSIVLLVGLLPLGGAFLMWSALSLADTGFAGGRSLVLTLWGCTAFIVGWAAYRRGASRWAALWGLAGAVATLVFFLGIFLVELESAKEGTGDEGGCPAGRIYC
jgi:hypothetical protein